MKEMKHPPLILAGVVALAALSLASPLGASPDAGKLPLRIDAIGDLTPNHATVSGTFSLIGASAAYTDSGSIKSENPVFLTKKTPQGQIFFSFQRTELLKGKHGALVLRLSARLFPLPRTTTTAYVLTGTWSIVRGTGRYTGLKGGGGIVGSARADEPDVCRYEGYVTRP